MHSCLCFLLIGCSNYYFSNDSGSYLPKNPNFVFQDNPYNLKQEDLLDENSIYIAIDDSLQYGNQKVIFYYRFFRNGRCYRNSVDASEKTNIDKLNAVGSVGYYNVKDTNTLEMEFFQVKDKERGWYFKSKGIIKKDTLFISGINKKGGFKEYKYVAIKMAGLPKNATW